MLTFLMGFGSNVTTVKCCFFFFFLLPPFCKAELGGLNPLNLPAFSLVTPFYNCLLTYQLLRSLKLYLTPQFLDSGTLLALNKCLNE